MENERKQIVICLWLGKTRYPRVWEEYLSEYESKSFTQIFSCCWIL